MSTNITMTKMRTNETPHDHAHSVVASLRPRGRVFAPKVWFTLLALAIAVGTALLSRWQFARADEKTALQTQLEALQKAPPLASVSKLNLPAQRYVQVQIAGSYDAAKTILHDNQIQAGKAGLHAYALFRPANGESAFLVNRGWLALPTDRRLIAAPAIPAAKLVLQGRVNVPAARTKRLAENADTAMLVQTIDLAELGARFGEPLAPFIVEQTTATDGDSALVRSWTPPNLKITTHRMYAGQWLCFSALSITLWLVLSFRKPKP